VTFRIGRLSGGDRTIFALSGELREDELAMLGAEIEREKPRNIVLDLGDVTLVTREGVRFIRRAEAEGAELVNCPSYLRRWIAAGRDEA
jgi:ABC-type transporter Mla MlaB component